MNKQTRTYEEIITLQDKAIEALTQANAALVMALEALKNARAEHGQPLQFPGFGKTLGGGQMGNSAPYVGPYQNTYTVDSQVPQWSGMTANMVDKTTLATSLISQANSQKALAQDYIAAFQASVKEQDEVSQVGGCI